jgi:glycosyltransferase involved in cell wall biosynthesis
LSFSNIAWDARVLRQVEFAIQRYKVDVIGYGAWESMEGVTYYPVYAPKSSAWKEAIVRTFYMIAGRFFSRFWDEYFWKRSEYIEAKQMLIDGKYDLIHANDWTALPVAVIAAADSGTKVLYDAHEYTPGQFSQYFSGRYLKSPYYVYLLKKYSGAVDKFITVSDGIANLYKENLGWNVSVVRNAPAYKPYYASPVDEGHLKIVHHGAATSGRNLEDLIYLVPFLDKRFTLTFILMPTDVHYLQKLKKLAERIDEKRIIFLDPVPPAQITQALTAYDIGIPVLPPVNLNHLYALPNKFFDYIMAGIGVAVLALPEMKKIIDANKIGVASSDFSWKNLAASLNFLSVDAIVEFKANALALAKQFNAEVEMGNLMVFYDKLLSFD